MARRKKVVSPLSSKFVRETSLTLESGRVVERGEIIKISGEHGTKFKFLEHVVNIENGAEWIDCFELYQGTPSGWRSFKRDRIKLIPKKRRRSNVKNN
jgi:hypothetical protein